MFNFEYVGNLHIHSSYSDGANTSSEIIGAAKRAGLDFICLNDHAHMVKALHLAEEGLYGNVLLLVGSEIGVSCHHYLAYGLKEEVKSNDQDPQRVIDQVNSQGGLGFLAHPFEKGMPFVQKSIAYIWHDFSVTGFTGICIWNYMSRWKERVKSIFHGMYFLMFKKQTLKGPSRQTLTLWDDLCQQRRVVAIGGSDVHGTLFKWGLINLRPFSYDYLLGTINIHIFLNKRMPRDFKEAKEEIYSAMREGRLFIAHDRLAPARGFKFDFIADDGSDSFMGEKSFFQKGNLIMEIPKNGEIRLIRNGMLEKTWVGTEAIYRVEERGVYRVEVYIRHFPFGLRPWIFSNPIYLR